MCFLIINDLFLFSKSINIFEILLDFSIKNSNRLIYFKSAYNFQINLYFKMFQSDISNLQINLLITKLFKFFKLFLGYQIKKYF